MRILFDERWLGNTGIGRYANETIKRIPDDLVIEQINKKWEIKNPFTPLLLGSCINKSKPDLFWSPGFMPPARCSVPYVVTVHDLIHLHYGTLLHRLYYNNIMRDLLRKAKRILTVSEFSKNELIEWLDLPEDKIITTYNAVSDDFCNNGVKYSPGFQYILYVGNRRKYKNIHRLVEAFGQGCRNTNIRLVLSGLKDDSLLESAKKAGILDRIVFLGQIPEADLPSVYRGALAVAYISLYEGFGLPPLESMACGTPVLTSNVTSLPEVVGDAAILVNPYNTEEIAHGLRRLVEDSTLRRDLSELGLMRAQNFSWEKSAATTWQVLKEAAC